MKERLPEKNDIPKGYKKVTKGIVQKGDKCWNNVHFHFQPAVPEIGYNVSNHTCVIREVKKIKTPEKYGEKKPMTPVEALELIVQQANAQFSCGDRYATFSKQTIGLIEEVLAKEHQK